MILRQGRLSASGITLPSKLSRGVGVGGVHCSCICGDSVIFSPFHKACCDALAALCVGCFCTAEIRQHRKKTGIIFEHALPLKLQYEKAFTPLGLKIWGFGGGDSGLAYISHFLKQVSSQMVCH